MVPLKTANGYEFFVDDEDCEHVKTRIWWYCEGTVKESGQYGMILSHFVLSINEDSVIVDHRDRNPLNNTKANLRVCTHMQNMWNRKTPSNNTTGVKGVSFHKRGKYFPWQMQITANGKRVTEYYPTLERAARAYNRLALQLHGEFASLNDLTKLPSFIGPTKP